jgi:Ca2+-binding RTX toxin-like protein
VLDGPGRDNLPGGAGDDWHVGGPGGDRLAGGSCADTPIGDAGADIFVFDRNPGRNHGIDCDPAGDRLNLADPADSLADVTTTTDRSDLMVWLGDASVCFVGLGGYATDQVQLLLV